MHQSGLPEHETASNCVWFVGLGVETIFHEDPFHSSARLNSWRVANSYATAMQEEPEAHEIASRYPEAGDGLGLVTTLHFLPFHCSTKVSSPESVMTVSPTARHIFAAGQETPDSRLRSETGGTGAGVKCQEEPFQLAATEICPVGPERPTAIQLLEPEHEIAVKPSIPCVVVKCAARAGPACVVAEATWLTHGNQRKAAAMAQAAVIRNTGRGFGRFVTDLPPWFRHSLNI